MKYPIFHYRLLIALLLFGGWAHYGIAQKEVDSLEQLYWQGNFKPSDSLQILQDLASDNQDPQKILQYSDLFIEVAKRQDSTARLFHGYFQKGNGLSRLGNPADALENYLLAANLANTMASTDNLGRTYIVIADAYSLMDNEDSAIEYYRRAIDLLRKNSDTLGLASVLSNAGDLYFKKGELDSSLIYFHEAGSLFKAKSYTIGIGYYLGSIGMVYGAKGQFTEALEKLNECLEILENERDYYGIAAFLPYISNIYKQQGDYLSAIRYAERSLDLGVAYRLKEQIRDANLLLSELYELQGNTDKSLIYYKEYTIYKDSISNIGLVQQMARQRADYEIDQKQVEVDLLEKEAEISELREKRQDAVLYVTIAVLLLVFVLALGFYRRFRYIKRTRDIIEKEKSRSDELLRNILPEETAQELKESGRVQAKKFESVSVMFADFVGFTSYSEKMSPEDLVRTVDYYFSRFDQVVEKYGLEKIKTMGDCYMCAGGLPFRTEDHPAKMVHLAREFINIVAEDGYSEVTGFQIRLGINTGPVVAGVVGTKKFAYDIWGDTVNIAARMEAASEPGKINVSENTYLMIRDHFECEYRGMIQVKNKGMMKMYFIVDSKDPMQPLQATEDTNTRTN